MTDHQAIGIMAAPIFASLKATNEAQNNGKQIPAMYDEAVQHAQNILNAARKAAGPSLPK